MGRLRAGDTRQRVYLVMRWAGLGICMVLLGGCTPPEALPDTAFVQTSCVVFCWADYGLVQSDSLQSINSNKTTTTGGL